MLFIPGKWGRLRIKSNLKEYRHGSKPKSKPARIFSGEHRKHALNGVISYLRSFRNTPFENEATCRNGIRQNLCLKGHSWEAADNEALALVSEALKLMGAKRPDWNEGQWHYSIPRENCARCGRDIDESDQLRGFRYCSDVCAKSYRQHISVQVPWDHELRWQGYWQIVIANAPVKSCPTCEKSFKSIKKDAEYCSPECLPQRQRTLEKQNCKNCQTIFQPDRVDRHYCSTDCYHANQAVNYKRHASAKVCPVCSNSFTPGSPQSLYCSNDCWKVVKNERRRLNYVAAAQRK